MILTVASGKGGECRASNEVQELWENLFSLLNKETQ
jgi:hypothetical protein